MVNQDKINSRADSLMELGLIFVINSSGLYFPIRISNDVF